MKKQLFTLVISLICYSAFATDRVVDQTGAGGTFFTVQSAVDAAVSGDRIIITPGQTFNEFLTINNKSLELIPRTEGGQFILNQITIQFATSSNYKVTISGGKILQSILISTTAFNYATINTVTIFRSTLPSEDIMATGTRLNVYRSYAQGIFICYGKVIGCSFNVMRVEDNARTIPEDTVFIVGNIIGNGISNTTTNLLFNNPNSYAYISNNYLGANVSVTNNSNRFIDIQKIKTSTSKASWVVNNLLGNTSAANRTTGININIDVNTILKIYNNYFLIRDNTIAIRGNIPAQNLLDAQYNQMSSPSASITGVTTVSNNQLSINNTITNFIITSGPGINGGHPSTAFVDLDGTANDVGTGGGSFSIKQFPIITGSPNPPGSGSEVGFLVVPRVVHPGEKINIKVDGFDK